MDLINSTLSDPDETLNACFIKGRCIWMVKPLNIRIKDADAELGLTIKPKYMVCHNCLIRVIKMLAFLQLHRLFQ